MHPIRHALIAALVVLSTTTGFAQQPQEPLPTMQDLRQLLEQKQWQPLLQKLSRVLTLKGSAAQPFNRYELLTMKGEAHAQLKQSAPAIQAFTEAAKEAGDARDKAAVASSTALLIKRSQSFVYKRKSPTTQPDDPKTIDVLDIDKRKQAFAVLAADEFAVLQTKARGATNSNNLGGVIEIVKAIGDLKSAELASGVDSKLADELMAPLASHAREVTSKAVSDDRRKVEQIEKNANVMVETGDRPRPGVPRGAGSPRYKKRGLLSTDADALRNVIKNCNTIAGGAKQLADAFGDAGKPLLDVVKDAQEVSAKANTVLTTDYSGTTSSPGSSR